MKALLTLRTAPRNNSAYSQNIIDDVAAPGAAATAGMASWANHYVQSKISKLMVLYFIIYKSLEALPDRYTSTRSRNGKLH
jgi:hypothetical protein